MSDKAIRQEFADTMLEVGQKDNRLVVLIADISHFLLQPFAKACPGRFYNIGICEPTMVNLAAGLSKVGLIPVVHTISPFLIERSFEQIKVDFGYQKVGGKFVSVGSAFDYLSLGCTHHLYYDFAILKNIEGMELVYPSSSNEFNILFKQSYDNGNPTYFRMPSSQHGIDTAKFGIEFGRGILVKEGKDVTMIVTGPQLKTAMSSAEKLEADGISAEVVYIHTLKPLDTELIRKSLMKTKKCVVIEEHSKYGGLFDDVLRCSIDLGLDKYESINTGDKFIRGYGSYSQYCEILGFTVEGVIGKVRLLLGH